MTEGGTSPAEPTTPPATGNDPLPSAQRKSISKRIAQCIYMQPDFHDRAIAFVNHWNESHGLVGKNKVSLSSLMRDAFEEFMLKTPKTVTAEIVGIRSRAPTTPVTEGLPSGIQP